MLIIESSLIQTGESHLNCCGFGFNGFDEKTKKPKWDLLSCVDIIPFEVGRFLFFLFIFSKSSHSLRSPLTHRQLAGSMKTGLDYWNKTTQTWLRFVAYDRVNKFKLLNTYLLSALW